MLKIVQRTRVLTHGRYQDLLQRRLDTDGFNYNYAIPIAELAGGRSHNYKPIKDAARALKNWEIEYYDKASRKWYLTSMIDNIILEERAGILRFSCSKWLIDYIVDFRNGGYRSYDFERAMALRNPFAARLYLLTASQTSPRRYALGALKDILGVGGRYARLHDFIRRCVEPARAELEAAGANGFSYEIIRRYKDKPRSEPIGLILTPVKREHGSQNISERIKEAKASMPELLYQYLMQQWKFSAIELANNKDTLASFVSIGGWQEKFVDISDRARRKHKGHGYLIGAMKATISEKRKEQGGLTASLP